MSSEFEKYLQIVDIQMELIKVYYLHSDRIQNKESSTIGDSSLMQVGRLKPKKDLNQPNTMAELKKWIVE